VELNIESLREIKPIFGMIHGLEECLLVYVTSSVDEMFMYATYCYTHVYCSTMFMYVDVLAGQFMNCSCMLVSDRCICIVRACLCLLFNIVVPLHRLGSEA
jgi:hypothetical protein